MHGQQHINFNIRVKENRGTFLYFPSFILLLLKKTLFLHIEENKDAESHSK
jgi:hypothetical protein